jgi:hypothetical protein
VSPVGGAAPGAVAKLDCPTVANCVGVGVGANGVPDTIVLRTGSSWHSYGIPAPPGSPPPFFVLPCAQSCAAPTGLTANVALNLIDGDAGGALTGAVAGVVDCHGTSTPTCWTVEPTAAGYAANVLPKTDGTTVSI